MNLDLPALDATRAGAAFGSIPFRAASGFNWSVVFNGVTGTPTYDVMLVVERLG